MTAIGIVETNSIPRGILVTDSMTKVTSVDVIESCPLCPGKYITIVSGSVDNVRTAVDKGVEAAAAFLVDSSFIASIHPSVLPAIMRAEAVEVIDALAIIETHAMASCLEVADKVAKAAEVVLIEFRLSRCLGGKSFVSFTGDIAAVRCAATVGEDFARSRGQLVHSVVIPKPHEKLHRFLI